MNPLVVPLRPRLLVLVVAQKDPSHDVNWVVWRRTMVARHPSVDVHLLVADPAQAQAQAQAQARPCISVKVEAGLVPGMLLKTVEALAWMLPRQNYTHVLLTNLSSVWHWPQVVERAARIPSETPVLAGVRLVDDVAGPFVSGAGMLLSRKAAQLLVEHRGRLCANVLDDVAIGRLLCTELGCPVVDMWARFDFVGWEVPRPEAVAAAARDPGYFHWRIKGQGANRIAYDAWVLGLLSQYISNQ